MASPRDEGGKDDMDGVSIHVADVYVTAPRQRLAAKTVIKYPR